MFSLLSILATVTQAGCGGPDCSIPSGHAISEPIRSCTQGFYYDDISDCCTRDVAAEPLYSCSHVGGIIDGLDCRCLVGQTISCPTGTRYNVSSNTCDATELAAMIPSCAGVPDSTLTPDGRKCVFDTTVEPILKCPHGSWLKDGVCVGSRKLPEEYISYTCPSGWQRVGLDLCETLEEISCDHVAVKGSSCSGKCESMEEFKPCKSPCKHYGKVKSHKGRRLCDKDDCEEGHSADVMCEIAACQMQIGLPELPNDSALLSNDTCTRTTHLPAKCSCSTGTMKSGHCIEEFFTTPIISCPKGCKDFEGTCIKEKAVSSDYVCPSGFEVQCDKPGKVAHPSRCECVQLNTVEPLLECPIGTELLPSGECLRIQPAEAYCADVDFVLNGASCVGKDHEPVRLEYIVTYVTEKACHLEECIKDNIPVIHKSVRNKHVSISHDGKTSTKCDVEQCVTASGDVLAPGQKYNRYPEATVDDAEDYFGTEEPGEEVDEDISVSVSAPVYGKESL